MILLGVWALGLLFTMGVLISLLNDPFAPKWSPGQWVFAALVLLISWPVWLGVWLGGDR